jgi:hypothetical protein
VSFCAKVLFRNKIKKNKKNVLNIRDNSNLKTIEVKNNIAQFANKVDALGDWQSCFF